MRNNCFSIETSEFKAKSWWKSRREFNLSLVHSDFQTSPKSCWIVNRAGSRSGSESAGINSTVRSYPYPVNRTLTDDPKYGENGPWWGLIHRKQILVTDECKGILHWEVCIPSLAGQSDSRHEPILEEVV